MKGGKGDYLEVGKRKAVIGLQVIKIMCSLEDGHAFAFEGYYLWHFKGVLI